MSDLKSSNFIQEASLDDQSFIQTIISELSLNIIKYAGRGEISLVKLSCDEFIDIDIWAEDQGKGIEDIELAMQDSFSTSDSLGLGLPGVKRMADKFWIRSNIDQGTLVHVRKRIKGKKHLRSNDSIRSTSANHHSEIMHKLPAALWESGFQIKKMNGQIRSGDFVLVQQYQKQLLVMVIDMTGHGEAAHQEGTKLISFISQKEHIVLHNLFQELHEILKDRIGAAVGAMLINTEQNSFEYIGVGNTKITQVMGKTWTGVSKDGVLGQRFPHLFVETGMLSSGDLFILTTDGIPSLLSNEFINKNQHTSASKLAKNVITNYANDFDDAACLVLKWL
jgi:hypothetical protein